MRHMEPLRSGERVSHFRIERRLGEGAMGVVYLAEDEALGRRVALKVLPLDTVGDKERRARLLREARLTAAVVHPSIAAIFEVGDDRGTVFLAMEYVRGTTLRARLQEGPVPLEEAISLATEIVEGLASAHDAGIVHRDLKPENLMVCDGHVKILDFGLAKLREMEEARHDSQAAFADTQALSTEEGRVLGTPAYMSPEQVRAQVVDHRSDIFAFGAVFYEMVTGRRPFVGGTAMELAGAILHAPIAPPSASMTHASALVDLLTLKCLERDPGLRYQGARELLVDLRRLRREDSAGATRPQQQPKRTGARPTRLWLVGIGALLLAAGLVAGVLLERRHAGRVRDTSQPPRITAAASAPRFRGAGATTPHRGGVLRFSVAGDIRGVDPAVGFDEFSLQAQHLLFDTLLAYDSPTSADPTRLVPQLAETWSVSSDGLTYSFTLRGGVTFSDGEPVVAEDFVYGLGRVLDPGANSPYTQFFKGVAGVRAVDERHLEIRLHAPNAEFPLLLAMKCATPQKRSWMEKVAGHVGEKPLGTGPFVLTGWDESRGIEFARNSRYWNARLPYLDGIVLLPRVKVDFARDEFLPGRLDTVDRIWQLDRARFDTPAWQPYILQRAFMASYGALMNCERPPFNDKRVRQAINYAVNKENVIRVLQGEAVVSHGILPPSMPGYDTVMRPYAYDPAKARTLLAEAGYPYGFSVTLVGLDDPLSGKIDEALQADLANVGVRVTIQKMTFVDYFSAVSKREPAFADVSWYMDYPDPRDFIELKFHSSMMTPNASTNDSGYSNPALDRVLDAARVEQDRGKRLELYHQAELILFEDAPWLYLYHPMKTELRQPYVMNYAIHPVWLRDYREVWLDEPRTGAP